MHEPEEEEISSPLLGQVLLILKRSLLRCDGY